MKTPLRDKIKERIPEPRAIEEMIALAGDLERFLREIHNAAGGDWDNWMLNESCDWFEKVDDYLNRNEIDS